MTFTPVDTVKDITGRVGRPSLKEVDEAFAHVMKAFASDEDAWTHYRLTRKRKEQLRNGLLRRVDMHNTRNGTRLLLDFRTRWQKPHDMYDVYVRVEEEKP